MGDHPEPISPERERGEKNRAHGSNGKDGWIGEALDLPARSRFGEGRAQPL